MRKGERKRCCCDDANKKTYLFCFADSVSIMADRCVLEMKKRKWSGSRKSEHVKKVKLIWGKSGVLDPKFYKDLTVKFISNKMRAYRAECQLDGIRADGNRYSHADTQTVHHFQPDLLL